ncbi:MAG: YihA family ribosome biogenesis GTP-binding protein [Hyphomicrobiales bacterium]|nr:ribosome biogenesis GTP-binding protein YihA/YsxC [Hyphomicrobiales bacterium]MDE1972449.1 YihA family ribosome biogenesis GTP-binding protein [Hyphomicrobiales bacterium]MDE2284676.1 YihA family ribosome biogenesis GTP-binding protein [Hyphomicrobiales bacterium]
MSAATEFSDAEIEAGRRLFAGEWSFLSAAGSLASLPPARTLEVAFAGRSNVGKSSLINALTGRRSLARTSNTPGRTQELIFFGGPHRMMLVDLPGYGYAAAAKSKVAAWTRLIHAYLNGRATLARVYVLIDARHGLKAVDEIILDTLGQAAVSYEIVLTKSDQVTAAKLAECRRTTLDSIHNRPAAFPDIVATSAHTGDGIPTLRAAIGRLIREREHIAGRGSDPGRRVPSCR